jgi:hypothetical protein
MSAIGPKRTSLVAPHMSAFGGKADTLRCGVTLLRSLSGAKRTCLVALHMSAFDPKRTLLHRFLLAFPVRFASASISLEIKILSDRSSAFAMATAICLMLGLTRI